MTFYTKFLFFLKPMHILKHIVTCLEVFFSLDLSLLLASSLF